MKSIDLIRHIFSITTRIEEVSWAPRYFVDDQGNVYSTCWWRGDPNSRVRLLKKVTNSHGYDVVSIRQDGRTKVSNVHLLIANAFNGEPAEGFECCHNNGIKTDNRADNLRWATKSSNSQDRFIHGTDPCGERNGRAKLTEEAVREIRGAQKRRGSQTRLARKYGVHRMTIARVLSGENW